MPGTPVHHKAKSVPSRKSSLLKSGAKKLGLFRKSSKGNKENEKAALQATADVYPRKELTETIEPIRSQKRLGASSANTKAPMQRAENGSLGGRLQRRLNQIRKEDKRSLPQPLKPRLQDSSHHPHEEDDTEAEGAGEEDGSRSGYPTPPSPVPGGTPLVPSTPGAESPLADALSPRTVKKHTVEATLELVDEAMRYESLLKASALVSASDFSLHFLESDESGDENPGEWLMSPPTTTGGDAGALGGPFLPAPGPSHTAVDVPLPLSTPQRAASTASTPHSGQSDSAPRSGRLQDRLMKRLLAATPPQGDNATPASSHRSAGASASASKKGSSARGSEGRLARRLMRQREEMSPVPLTFGDRHERKCAPRQQKRRSPPKASPAKASPAKKEISSRAEADGPLYSAIVKAPSQKGALPLGDCLSRFSMTVFRNSWLGSRVALPGAAIISIGALAGIGSGLLRQSFRRRW